MKKSGFTESHIAGILKEAAVASQNEMAQARDQFGDLLQVESQICLAMTRRSRDAPCDPFGGAPQ